VSAADATLALRRRVRRSRRTPLGLLLAGLLGAALAIVPIVFVALEARGVSASEAWHLLVRPRVGGLLANTLGLLAAATVTCSAVGIAAAWCVERTDLPGRHAWTVVLVLPLAVPEFVSSFGWVSFFPSMKGFWAALLVTTLAYYPFVYLPAAAMLRAADPALEETAQSLGLGRWRTFWRVSVPQVRLAALGGALIIALHLLAEYGAFAQLRFPTFATEIYAEYQLGFDGASAALLSLVLVAISIVVLGGELGLRGRGRYARVGGGAARRQVRIRLGTGGRLLTFAGLGALAALALGLPLTALVYWIAQGSSSTLPSGSIVGAAGTTFGLAAVAALATVAIALPIALLAVRYPTPLSALLERCSYVARALPGVVIGLALVSFSVRSMRSIYQTPALLVIAYVILFLPLALATARAALAQISPRLEEVAQSLGDRPVRAFARTTLPLLGPGLAAAASLVFLSTVTELTATLLLRPTGTDTLATEFWTYASALSYGAAAPYAAVMVGVSAIPTYLLVRQLDARTS
jgi:iron(III) transport system permease protein